MDLTRLRCMWPGMFAVVAGIAMAQASAAAPSDKPTAAKTGAADVAASTSPATSSKASAASSPSAQIAAEPAASSKKTDAQPAVQTVVKETVVKETASPKDRAPDKPGQQGSAAEPLKPIPEAQHAGPVPIEAASFKGVTPGVTTLEETQKAWGAPKEVTRKGSQLLHMYRVEPFQRVEVTFVKDKATAIVIRLERSFPATAVAQQLELTNVRPVLVSNTLGEILGQSFPERGVLFAFEPSGTPGKPTMKVSQIILEPITAEPFVLRAETNLDGRSDLCLSDLDQALKLAPANARAHWLRARVLMAGDDVPKALAAADEAVRLEPENPRYRVTRAQILGQAGRYDDAIQEAEKAVTASEKRPHVKARALCLLGDLAGSGPQPDYKRALNYHTEAIKTADPLTASPHPAVRLPAKEVLIDAHLGAAHDTAWGSWNQKAAAVDKWLQRAAAFAEEMVQNDGGTAEHRFRVATRALTAYVGVQGKLDPGQWTEEALRVGQELIASLHDPVQKQQVQWDLGIALYDAVQLYQMRKEYDAALKYGQQAATFLEQGAVRKQDSPTDNYFLGRLYFRLGAIHAVGEKKDHQAAIRWFDKASPVLEKTIPRIDTIEKGRLGETFVSMGVSYWETGQRDKSVEFTALGVGLMEQAVKDGTLDKSALEIPYGNLATMYRQLGKPDEADRYLEKASKNTGTIRR